MSQRADNDGQRGFSPCGKAVCSSSQIEICKFSLRKSADFGIDTICAHAYNISYVPITFLSSSMAEHSAVNRGVVGSSPTWGAKAPCQIGRALFFWLRQVFMDFFMRDPGEMSSPRVVVHKACRLLEVWNGEALVARMAVALGREPVGGKLREGDGRTPEGDYRACVRNDKSKYHLAIGLDYPNPYDAALGLASGLIGPDQYNSICLAHAAGSRPPWDTALGGEIMVHGGGAATDWTAGCIAVDDGCMDYLWKHIGIGTQVRILP